MVWLVEGWVWVWVVATKFLQALQVVISDAAGYVHFVGVGSGPSDHRVWARPLWSELPTVSRKGRGLDQDVFADGEFPRGPGSGRLVPALVFLLGCLGFGLPFWERLRDFGAVNGAVARSGNVVPEKQLAGGLLGGGVFPAA